MKLQDPAHRVVVVERNRPSTPSAGAWCCRTRRWTTCAAADPPSGNLIGDALNHWDDIEVFFKGRSVRSGGHGFCGIGRKHLLNILQDRCLALGVELVFERMCRRPGAGGAVPAPTW
jgi:anthraniloyl-CoA monooxygenase